jgi:hypothetical protein
MEFGKSIAQAALHPINTATTAIKLGGGIVELMLDPALKAIIPEGSWLWNKSNNPDQAGTAPADLARSVGKFYAQKYGSVEGAKRAIASDPVGVLSDISSVFGVGATLPGKIGQISATASKLANPITVAAKGVSLTGKGIGAVGDLAESGTTSALGNTTGAGSAAIKEAAAAGAAGGSRAEQFLSNMRGKVDPTELVDIAKENLGSMREAKSQQYRSGMIDISRDKTVLDLADTDAAVANAEKRISFKGQIKDAKAADAIAETKKLVDAWKALDPTQYHTPEGLDALKQQIGSVLESLPYAQRHARAVIGDVYSSVRKTISKQAPTYGKVMSEYEAGSDAIKEIEKALSLNDKASVDTALRKLTSIMRNNVNTNFGQRTKLAEKLQQAGGAEFIPGIAGQSLNSPYPRGIQGGVLPALGAGTFMGAGFIPAAGVLAASSPRLVGEAAYYAGKAGGAIGNTGNYARKAGSYAGNKINALSGGRIGKAANYAGGKINSLAGMTPEMLKNIQMYNTMHQVQNAGNQQQ